MTPSKDIDDRQPRCPVEYNEIVPGYGDLTIRLTDSCMHGRSAPLRRRLHVEQQLRRRSSYMTQKLI